jgi:hypothetical protein
MESKNQTCGRDGSVGTIHLPSIFQLGVRVHGHTQPNTLIQKTYHWPSVGLGAHFDQAWALSLPSRPGLHMDKWFQKY